MLHEKFCEFITSNCYAEKSLVILQNNKRKLGMCETLIINCSTCRKNITTFKYICRTIHKEY